jgi:hypothetical protein
MARRVIEGLWEDLVGRDDLRGHRVRVIVIDEYAADSESTTSWLERLRAWSDAHAPVNHFIDDDKRGHLRRHARSASLT